jgi:hypothetical protein
LLLKGERRYGEGCCTCSSPASFTTLRPDIAGCGYLLKFLRWCHTNLHPFCSFAAWGWDCTAPTCTRDVDAAANDFFNANSEPKAGQLPISSMWITTQNLGQHLTANKRPIGS